MRIRGLERRRRHAAARVRDRSRRVSRRKPNAEPQQTQNDGLRLARDEYRTRTPNGSCVALQRPRQPPKGRRRRAIRLLVLDPDAARSADGAQSAPRSRLYPYQAAAQQRISASMARARSARIRLHPRGDPHPGAWEIMGRIHTQISHAPCRPPCASSRRSGAVATVCSPPFGCQQSAVERLGDGGRAVADAELGVDVEQVGLDGRLADEQPRGGLAVGRAAGDERRAPRARAR